MKNERKTILTASPLASGLSTVTGAAVFNSISVKIQDVYHLSENSKINAGPIDLLGLSIDDKESKINEEKELFKENDNEQDKY
ncbi:hypothetical protein RhiirA1_466348 [Rhizophagus irregularis]|uniref:Uncharacterized protein n=1 Tax=Rhizophagus irregularis TaxID=588596 RepID=A0A2N0RE23_9GLOM|nr:hypothetical protein RhiirA1_466348 [Rhizophagus irregularis]